MSLAYYKLGDLASTTKELSALRALSPGNQQALLLLADTWLQLGENKKVIDLLSPMQKQSQRTWGSATCWARRCCERSATTKDSELERFRRGESAESRLLIGTAKLNAADFTGALEDLNKAVELNPNLPSVNAYQGQALMETGDAVAAAKAFQRELALNPNHFMSNLNVAVLLKQEQQFDEALNASAMPCASVLAISACATSRGRSTSRKGNRRRPKRSRSHRQDPDFVERMLLWRRSTIA